MPARKRPQTEQRKAYARAWGAAHKEQRSEYRRGWLERTRADPERNAARLEQMADYMHKRDEARRARQAHPCPRCGRTAYYLSTTNGRYAGLCQPCASSLDDIASRRLHPMTGGTGSGTTMPDDYCTVEEQQWEREALQQMYLPSLADRWRRNGGFDVDIPDSFGPS